MSPQASQSASEGVVEVKEAHIVALQTELRGRDRLLQAKPKVRRAGVSSTAPQVHYTHTKCVMWSYGYHNELLDSTELQVACSMSI